MIVVDASAAIRWFMPAVPGQAPHGLPATDDALVAPDLFIAEVRSAALTYLRKGELKREQARAMIDTIDQLMAGYFPLDDFREAAWTMALDYDHSPYDCFYIAVAESIGSSLVTADERLIRKFASTGHARHIVHLQDWRP